ncbi:hypothetical protein [Nocardia sp. XZ_19_231]|uniref:hypothetical protein n=1 Tax=Nocardia sp. XZ_19_231 TaxID=2769252 RepID=UPI00188F0BFA|nr:hypothetical protein [Nocardia sp. XZ_19_231]
MKYWHDMRATLGIGASVGNRISVGRVWTAAPASLVLLARPVADEFDRGDRQVIMPLTGRRQIHRYFHDSTKITWVSTSNSASAIQPH